MSIKIKIKPNKKAMVRFTHPMDEKYFTDIIKLHRDDGKPHPKIILKNKNGENIPRDNYGNIPMIKKNKPAIIKGEPK